MMARASMLEAIRRSLAESAPFDATRRRPAPAPPIPDPSTPGEPALDRFRRALEAVGGRLTVARSEDDAVEAVRSVLVAAGARSVAVSNAPIVERVMRRVAIDGLELERSPSRDALFASDAGVTSAQWAIVETGTLVLDSDAERHRLASLVPPVHVAILEASRVRETLAEVLREASAGGLDALPRALTFITGPSRTSDIELTLAIGVHGPGEVHVVVVEGDRDG